MAFTRFQMSSNFLHWAAACHIASSHIIKIMNMENNLRSIKCTIKKNIPKRDKHTWANIENMHYHTKQLCIGLSKTSCNHYSMLFTMQSQAITKEHKISQLFAYIRIMQACSLCLSFSYRVNPYCIKVSDKSL